MSTQNLIEQLGYDLAKKTLDDAPEGTDICVIRGKRIRYYTDEYKFWTGTWWLQTDHTKKSLLELNQYLIGTGELRTQLAEYEAGIAHSKN